MNRISVQQLFELRQKTTGNNIVVGQWGTGKTFFIKKEIAHILNNTDDDILLSTASGFFEGFMTCFHEYRNRICLYGEDDFKYIKMFAKERGCKAHLYMHYTDVTAGQLKSLLSEAGLYDITIVGNDLKEMYQYYNGVDLTSCPCMTVLDLSKVSMSTEARIMKKARLRDTDCLLRYTNVFVTDGSIYEISF